jgi:uncharacterized protein (DUF1501 family)
VPDLSTPPLIAHPFPRRRFLQFGAMSFGAAALTPYLSHLQAFAAPPVKSDEGILVVVQLGGGNDGLNTLVPTGTSRYYTLRGSIAIPAADALPVGTGFGLHPSLVKLKSRFDAGDVAIVRGAGYQPPDLSHFTSTDLWTQGWGGSGSATTGWLGRFLDGLPGSDDESLYGVSLHGSIPRHLTGAVAKPSALPLGIDDAFGIDREDPSDVRMYDAFASFGDTTSGLGAMGDLYGDAAAALMELCQRVKPAYGFTGPSSDIGRQLALAAHLVNANLGIRVFTTSFGSFDTHADQPWQHAQLLAELDEGIEAFFAALAPAWRGRCALVTFSEFGRRPEANGDYGTDHGTASVMFVVGEHVKGGLHGAQPSLTDLDASGNLKPAVDFRSVYATLLAKWLKADDHEVLGKTYSQLDLFRQGPTAVVAPPPVVPSSKAGYWLAGPAGMLASYGQAPKFPPFGRPALPIVGGAGGPGGQGLWLCATDGGIFAFGSAKFFGSCGGMRLNKPIVGMAATPTGKGYWLVATDGGIFAFGDARFYGSTGSMRLNKPIVGMAATPTGKGYWLVASDGGIFAFGDARFYGSTGSIALNKPVVGMAASITGKGYWLVASDGGIFAYGDAKFYGSAPSLGAPVCTLARTRSGKGYWMCDRSGGVIAFGDAAVLGRLSQSTSVLVAA